MRRATLARALLMLKERSFSLLKDKDRFSLPFFFGYFVLFFVTAYRRRCIAAAAERERARAERERDILLRAVLTER